MPELPEVEVLARHLEPLLKNRTIQDISVRRKKFIAPTSESELKQKLLGATFTGVSRRGKYLRFSLSGAGQAPIELIGHLGMTGRIYLLPKDAPLPKHAAVVLDLGAYQCVFEDTRYFGRLTLDSSALARLGPEPLGSEFTVDYFAAELKRSAQAIKVKLLDQSLVAGVGNIYASEALFRAGISPKLAANRLTRAQVGRLRRAIRQALTVAIRWGSTVPLDFAGGQERDGLFYYGSGEADGGFYEERLLVYDRAGERCRKCGTSVKRLVQAARSTYYCSHCQRV